MSIFRENYVKNSEKRGKMCTGRTHLAFAVSQHINTLNNVQKLLAV